MKKIKIGFFADGPWSHIALQKIIQNPLIELAFICARHNSTDKTLENKANEIKVDFFTVKDINSTESINDFNMIKMKNDKNWTVPIDLKYFNQLHSNSLKKLLNEIKEEDYLNIIKDLENIHSNVALILNNKKIIEELAVDFIDIKGSMFLGRGLSYPIALEGALKFKELTYLHAEGYPAGEMKHGPLALVENGMPVIVIAPKDRFYEKTISNMQEVIARGGKILLISDHAEEVATSENIWSEIRIPKIHKFLSPFLSNIPLQLLAYYVALKKGNDIDKPRNLAKSVTVE